jgi:hypothetical protein
LVPADGCDGLLLLPDGEVLAAGGGENGRDGAAGGAGDVLLPEGRDGVGRLPEGTTGDDLLPDEYERPAGGELLRLPLNEELLPPEKLRPPLEYDRPPGPANAGPASSSARNAISAGRILRMVCLSAVRHLGMKESPRPCGILQEARSVSTP